MIFEACRKGESIEGGNCCEESSFSAQYAWREVIPLAIATSIDALAAGVVFSPFPQWIIPAVLIVGATSFLFSLAGTEVGAFFGRRFRWKVDILGGIILVFIGVKILLEHLLSGNA